MNFITELIARLLSQTPWFMRNIRNISVAIALVTGLPAFLVSHGIDLPDAIDAIASKVVSIVGLISAVIAQVSVPGDTINQVTDNNPKGK